MRFYFHLYIAAVLLSGCTNNSAFARFDMSAERERSEENIQSVKLTDKELSVGIATAVHLNKAYPELYNKAEYFYIYLNIDANPKETLFRLNGKQALLVEELESTNEFTKLTRFDANWKHYYLVGFEKQKGTMELVITNAAANATFVFKNEEN